MSLQETPVSRHVRNASGRSRRTRKGANEMARLEMLLKRRAYSSSRFSCDKIIEAALS